MRKIRLAFCIGLLLPLAGCGSSGSPAMAVRCTTRHVSPSLTQVRLTVSDTTGTAGPAIVYGPALIAVGFVHPVLHSVEVVVRVGHTARSYPGWIIPRIVPKRPAHILFQLTKPASPASIVAATSPAVRARNWKVLENADCIVGKS